MNRSKCGKDILVKNQSAVNMFCCLYYRRNSADNVSIIPNVHMSFQHFKTIYPINKLVPTYIKCWTGHFNVPMTFGNKNYFSFFTKTSFEPCLTGAKLKLL